VAVLIFKDMEPQMNADGRRLVVKKLFVKISLVFGIIAALVLILLGLRLIDGDETESSYRFLDGRKPTVFKDVKAQGVDTFYAYSFEADFNDVCLKADAELIGAGFVVNTNIGKTLSGNEYSIRNYMQKNRYPRGPVWIVIQNNREYREHPDSEKRAISHKDGWVVVLITYWRSWRWPF
jgi:hypothetical protein